MLSKIRNRLTYNAGIYWEREGVLSAIARPFEYVLGVSISRQQINRVVPRLLRQMSGDIIDIGGNDNRLKKCYRGGKVINLDIVQRQFVDVVMDAGNMDIPSDSIGGVLCLSVIEHASSPEDIVREIHRVLKPGGLAYIYAPWMFEAHMEPNDFLRFSVDWLTKQLDRFEVLEVHYANALAGCVAHFMQHSLLLRCTAGLPIFAFDLLCKPGPKYATQIGHVLRKR